MCAGPATASVLTLLRYSCCFAAATTLATLMCYSRNAFDCRVPALLLQRRCAPQATAVALPVLLSYKAATTL